MIYVFGYWLYLWMVEWVLFIVYVENQFHCLFVSFFADHFDRTEEIMVANFRLSFP